MKKKRMTVVRIVLAILFFTVQVFSLSSCGREESNLKNASGSAVGDNEPAQRSIFAMDTYMTITAYGEKKEEAVDAAVGEIQRLEKLFSAQNEDSEVAIVNESGSEILSEETGTLIEKSLSLYDMTGGLFDIAIYPLMLEWGFVNEKYKVPEKVQIDKLLKNIDASQIEYDKENRLITLPDEMEIDLGGIAKGYTSARIMEIFKEYGVTSGLVSLGGNVQLLGSRQDGSEWRVGIQNPDTESQDFLGVLQVSDKAVITSGGYERYFEKDGVTYHHILDPRTGYPADRGLTSVTIVSDDGTLADGLSTSLFIMGKEDALAFWHRHEDEFDAILLDKDGGVTITEGLEEKFTSDIFSVTVEKREQKD